jgi:hypothetical protein
METIDFDTKVAGDLKRTHWALLENFDERLSPLNAKARQELVQEGRASAFDPFCKLNYRQRGYRRGLIMGGKFILEPAHLDLATGTEVVLYDQGDANPDFQGEARSLPALPNRIWFNPAFREIQERCYRIALQTLDLPATALLAWECHLIRLIAKPGLPAEASPNLIHFDDGRDRMLTFVVVIERQDVEGGLNMITARQCAGLEAEAAPAQDVFYRGVIERPFDGYAFADSDVAHYVSGITTAPGASHGARTILIFDFVKLIREPIAQAA